MFSSIAHNRVPRSRAGLCPNFGHSLVKVCPRLGRSRSKLCPNICRSHDTRLCPNFFCTLPFSQPGRNTACVCGCGVPSAACDPVCPPPPCVTEGRAGRRGDGGPDDRQDAHPRHHPRHRRQVLLGQLRPLRASQVSRGLLPSRYAPSRSPLSAPLPPTPPRSPSTTRSAARPLDSLPN